MKVYSIRYATTKGIVAIEDVEYSDDSPEYICKNPGKANMLFEKLGRDVFFSQKEASIAAAKKVNNKIISLEKKLEQLRNISQQLENA